MAHKWAENALGSHLARLRSKSVSTSREVWPGRIIYIVVWHRCKSGGDSGFDERKLGVVGRCALAKRHRIFVSALAQ